MASVESSEPVVIGLDDAVADPNKIYRVLALADDVDAKTDTNDATVDNKTGVLLEIPENIMHASKVLHTSLEKDTFDDNAEYHFKVKAKAQPMKHFIEYATINHKSINHVEGGMLRKIPEHPLKSNVFGENKDIAEEDVTFLDGIVEQFGMPGIYDLILTANYLDCKHLLHLSAAYVASKLKGQPLNKIKKILDPNGVVDEKTMNDEKTPSATTSTNNKADDNVASSTETTPDAADAADDADAADAADVADAADAADAAD